MHETVTAKLKIQWRPQEVGDARNLEYLLGNGTGNEPNQPKKGAMWDATSTVTGERLLKLFGAHIMPPCAPYAGHGTTGFNVCPSGFQSCFGHIPSFFVSICPFWIGMCMLSHCLLEVCNLLLEFYRESCLFCLESLSRL
jgi:hypothetical protein